MADDKKENPEEKPEEKPANFLEELKREKENLIKIMEEIKRDKADFQEMKAQEILSGRTEAGSQKEEKKEISPEEYARSALEGRVNEKE